VDEASAHVKAKAQQPHDQKNRENCPKHVDPLPNSRLEVHAGWKLDAHLL